MADSRAAAPPADAPVVVLAISRTALVAACVVVSLLVAGLSIVTDNTPGIGVLQALMLAVAASVLGIGLLIAFRVPIPSPWWHARMVGINAALVLVGLGLALAVGEVGVRVLLGTRHEDIRLYQPSFVNAPLDNPQFDRRRFTDHPFLPYAPRAFDERTITLWHQDIQQMSTYTYTQNSLGFRGPERPFEKASTVKRIVVLGGSTTWDGPTNDLTWPALLEAKLNAAYARTGYTVEVINMATEGYASPMSLVVLAFDGVQFQPDLVISYDGVNDIWLEGWKGLAPDYRTGMGKFDEDVQTLQARLPNWMFRSYLVTWASKMYDVRVGNNHPTFFANDHVLGQVLRPLLTLQYDEKSLQGIEYFERNLRLMRTIAAEYQAKFVAATAHWVSPDEKAAAQNAYLREAFLRHRIDYLDLDALLPHDDWSLHVDQVHWTEKGLDQMATAWLGKIVQDDLLGLNARHAN